MPLAPLKPVNKRRESPAAEAIFRVADKHVPELERIFLRAVRELRASINVDDLTQSIEQSAFNAVFDIDMSVFEGDFDLVADAIRATYVEGARHEQQVLSRLLLKRATVEKQLVGRFDITNPRSVEYLRNHGAEFVTEISNSTREAIRQHLVRSYQDGIPPREIAREIKREIGLTPRQVEAVANYRAFLELPVGEDRPIADTNVQRLRRGGMRITSMARLAREGFRRGEKDKMVRNYADRLLKERALTIARTETINAASAGRQEMWEQAAEQGLIDEEDTKRVWHTSRDERVDLAICAPMHGQEVGFREPFTTGDGRQIMRPTAHPNCRCSVILRDVLDDMAAVSPTVPKPKAPPKPKPKPIPGIALPFKPFKGAMSERGFSRVDIADQLFEKNEPIHAKRKDYQNELETPALQSYVFDSYKSMNKRLRDGKKLTKKQQKDHEAMSGLLKGLDSNEVLYRGMYKSPGQKIKEYKVGEVETFEAWTSTSMTYMTAQNYGTGAMTAKKTNQYSHTLFEIHTPKGTKSIVTSAAASEVTIPPGQKMKIEKVIRDPETTGAEQYVVARMIPADSANVESSPPEPPPAKPRAKPKPKPAPKPKPIAAVKPAPKKTPKPVKPKAGKLLKEGYSQQRFDQRKLRSADDDVDEHSKLDGYVDRKTNAGVDNYIKNSGFLNYTLEQGKAPTGKFAEIHKGMNDALRTVPKSMVLYRGVDGLPDTIAKALSKGKSFDTPAWTSTSRSKEIADTFAEIERDTMFELHIDAGTKAVITNDQEAEVVLPPGARIEVDQIVRDQGRTGVKQYVVARVTTSGTVKRSRSKTRTRTQERKLTTGTQRAPSPSGKKTVTIGGKTYQLTQAQINAMLGN